MKHKGQFFVILGHVMPFDPPTPPNNSKNQNLEKMRKVPGDIIILHLCTINDDHMIYSSWDMEHNKPNFCHFGLFFALLSTIKILKNWKTCPEISFYICVWFLRYGVRQTDVFLILKDVLPFYPPSNPNNQNFEKIIIKKHLEILSFYTSLQKMAIIWSMVPDTWSTTDRYLLSFLIIFCSFTPLTTQNINILKKWKKIPGGINTLQKVCQKSWSYAIILFLRYGAWWM